MKFSDALDIRPGITAIIGGGGKTSLMLTLADELKEKTVVICTTTKIYPPTNMPVLCGCDMEAIMAAVKEHGAVCVGERCGEKLSLPSVLLAELAAAVPYVIVEADGAKGLPLKAHAEHEPVIPDGARVIYVIGADGIGQSISKAAHRPELYAEKLGVDISHTVTPRDAAAMVDYGETVLFNKVENTLDRENGKAFAEAFYGRTVIASLKEYAVYDIADNGKVKD